MKRKKLLDELRNFLLTRRETLRRMLDGELSRIGTDEDEESLDDEVYFVNAVSSAKELELIQAAIDRFRHGTYGTCEACERDIPTERLQTLPCAIFCINCQREQESQPRYFVEPDVPLNDSNQTSI